MTLLFLIQGDTDLHGGIRLSQFVLSGFALHLASHIGRSVSPATLQFPDPS
jgi:hypothetical protein